MTQREADVLMEIAARPDVPTYVIRNILAIDKGYGKGLKTGHILYSCKRLEAAGKIVRTHTSSNSACWRIAEQ
jgi:hypothetical protein